MSRLRVLLVTDSFPPHAGGSGWSTFELARQLAERGHVVQVVHAVPGDRSAIETGRYEGIDVVRFRRAVPDVPVVRNVLKNERMWIGLARYLEERGRAHPVDVIHGQHVMSTAPAVRAARSLGVPSIATVRDYWPVCYWSDLIVSSSHTDLCPACTTAGMRACTQGRHEGAGPVGWTVIPYMRRNLTAKQRVLREADAVIGVSSTITSDLINRSAGLDPSKVHTIPNPVDMRALDPPARRDQSPCILYAGKLATNKGVQFLLPALDEAGVPWPLVVVGDGPLRASLEAEARARNRRVEWLGWRDRGEVLDLMRRCTLLAFPSLGPESLSRVLIEAAALGTPIVAMNTGGTRDIVVHERTGLLSSSSSAFAADLARLAADETLRTTLGHGAAAHARASFEASAVAARVETVYRSVIAKRDVHR